MNTKTMEGLVGARTNMNLLNTPMRVYKEARRKGDTATMERAMGYACECSERAEEYKAKADKGMGEDARDVREKAKLQREEAIRKCKEEREKREESIEENIEESRNADVKETSPTSQEIREEGKALPKETAQESVSYTKTGEAIKAAPGASISVSV